MVDLLINDGTVATLNAEREIIDEGSVVVDEGRIVEVGPTETVAAKYDADQTIEASGDVVLPGFVIPHAHVSDILLRGGVSRDRSIHDWLFNVKKPGVHAMAPEDHEIAAALYCTEAIQAGITTFVELPEAILMGSDDFGDIVERKMAVYDAAGLRNVYAATFRDNDDVGADFERFIGRLLRKEPEVNHVPPTYSLVETADALERITGLIEEYHREAEGGRQSVWIAPEHVWTVTPEGFERSYDLAEEYDVMTTTHASETLEDDSAMISNVEYLESVDYLGERTLLAHCVHVDERDMRLLAATDTKVAHNPLTNLSLGSGFAPVPTMVNYGITVGMGTDNPSANDLVNPLSDLRVATLIQKAARLDAGALTAEQTLEMVTMGGARAIGREDELGSIERGKRADVVLLDTDHAHLTPRQEVAPTVVTQTQGHEVHTVVCEGNVIMEDGEVRFANDQYPNLLASAQTAAEAVTDRAGLSHLVDG